jgi:CheY-like chemotaxis protein
MVYGFAKQSGGAFRIASELGSGTTAELWLPRAHAHRHADEPAATQRPAPGTVRKLKILVVDDHAEVRRTTAAVLEDLGHLVHQAANGSDALRMLEGGDCDCDLMISDYAMPHLSGTEFLKRARELCPGVPALIITGYAQIDAIGDRPDGVEVLLKPFSPASLEAAIANIGSENLATG